MSSNLWSLEQHELISVLMETGASVVSRLPDAAGRCTLKIQGLSDMSARAQDIVVHSVGHGGVYVLASKTTIFVYDLDKRCLATQFSCVPALPRDAACANLKEFGLVIAIAGACGITIYHFDCNSRFTGPCSDMRTPHVLPGSYGYPCVSVAMSSSSFVAAANLDGRVAIWEIISESGTTLEFGEPNVFEPGKDCEMHDRVTDLQISRLSCSGRCQGLSDVLAVAWWSGRVDLYKCDGAWSFAKTLSLRNPETYDKKNYSVAPGTYLTFSADASVLAVCTGLGNLSFWSVPEGILISSSPIAERPPGTAHVKGFAAVAAGVVIWLRDMSDVVFASYPEPAHLAFAIALHARAKALDSADNAMNGTRRVYMDVGVQLVICAQLKCMEHRKSGSKKTTRIPFPCHADSIAVGHQPSQMDSWAIHNSGYSLAGTHLAASRKYVVFLMNFLVFVYTLDSGEWTVIISRSRLIICAIAEGFGDLSRGRVLCASEDGRGWRWDLTGLQRIDPPESPLRFHARARSIIGCSRGTGTFAVIADPPACDEQRVDSSSEFSLTLVESTSGSDALVRSVRLSTCGVTSCVGSSFPASAVLAGLWCTGRDAVILLTVAARSFSAFTIDTRGAELTLFGFRVLQGPVVKRASFGLVARAAQLPESTLMGALSSRR
jgi:WD40 repeat protein